MTTSTSQAQRALRTNAGTLTIDVDVLLTGSGILVGNVRNLGRIDVGGVGLAGTLTVQGNFEQGDTGVVNIEVGGPLLAQFDRILVSGTATLGGTLNTALINNFLPSFETFPFMTFANRIGSFAITNLEPGGGVIFTLLPNPTGLTLATNRL